MTTFDQLFKRQGAPDISDKERKGYSILVVEPEISTRATLRQALLSHGYGAVSDAPDHQQALAKMSDRKFTHVIFEAKRTNMPASEFLTKVLEMNDTTIAIPSSWDPNVDDVFNLLIIGARGYIVKPFSNEALDEGLVMATKGEPISESILYARNRNEALVSLILSSLDRLATTLRQAEQFETAKREVARRELGFKRAIDIGRTFAEGGVENLLETLIEVCVERGSGPASRLGRFRKRLEARQGRKKGDGIIDESEQEADDDSTETDKIETQVPT